MLVGDQSIFVKAAVTGVIREGLIAAGLTSLMILLFLGSWRSTIIVSTSIPSRCWPPSARSIFGQTLNTMTLGGLALAVGILVDEATVTIENINWHLEQGKPVIPAIIDGASQIVVPAFVSLLCICIVFVPMFFLPGVAGYLFVPMALSVVFAMIASFLLSRTLVPTMAMYLLKPHAVGGVGHEAGAENSRNVFVRFQRAFEERFEAFRKRYIGLLRSVLSVRKPFIIIFMGGVLVSFALLPFLGSNFFPDVDPGRSPCMCACLRAPASKARRRRCRLSTRPSAKWCPPSSSPRSPTTSACRSARSTPSTTTAARWGRAMATC
jgi:multidrug efflux pump subunit AcrB